MFAEQALELSIKTERFSGSVLRMAIREYLRGHVSRARQKQIAHGEQSLKDLNAQGRELTEISIADKDIQQLRRELNKYEVDFHIMRDDDAGIYHVFFKAQDIERVDMGLEKCALKFADVVRRPMKEQMADATKEAEQRNTAQAAEKTVSRAMQQEAAL